MSQHSPTASFPDEVRGYYGIRQLYEEAFKVFWHPNFWHPKPEEIIMHTNFELLTMRKIIFFVKYLKHVEHALSQLNWSSCI